MPKPARVRARRLSNDPRSAGYAGGWLGRGQAPNAAGWRGTDLASGRRGHRTLERLPHGGAGRHPRLTPTSLDFAGSRWTAEARYSRPETVLDTLNGFCKQALDCHANGQLVVPRW
jgi:hypothetical protein